MLSNESLLITILQWLVAQGAQDDEDYYTPKTRKQLLAAALTCVTWFHPSMVWLWRKLEYSRWLMRLLLPENLRSLYHTSERLQYEYVCTLL